MLLLQCCSANAVGAALLLAWAVFRLAHFRFGKRKADTTAERLRAEDAAYTEGEEKNARFRFTAGRLARALEGGPFDAVFVGSGPGSMACAASMARLGWKCCVLEQGEQLGGGAHVFSEAGYEFETGVHYLGKDKAMCGLLDFLSCGRLQLAPLGTDTPSGKMYDSIVVGEHAYPFCEGLDNLLAMLKQRFPEDHAKIERFGALLADKLAKPYQQSAADFFRLKVPYILEVAPLRWLRRLLQRTVMGGAYYRCTQMTSEDILRRCGIEVGSQLGAVILGQYGDAGMRPDKCSAMMHLGVMSHYIDGSCYPVGGSGAVPRKLNSVVLAAGGRSFVQARVTSLLLDASGGCTGVRVVGSGGSEPVEIKAGVVVSGTGALRSYRDLVAPLKSQLPRAARHAEAAVKRIEAAAELSVAFIFLFVGLDVPEDAPEPVREDRRNHNTWIYPEPDFTRMEVAIEAAEPWSRPMPMFVASGSAKDAAWASKHGERKKTVVVISQCPWAWVAPWAELSHEQRANDAGYAAFKARVKDELMEQGFRKVFPKLEPYIKHTSVGTPLSTNDFLATDQGECYGRGATPTRWMCPDLSPYTPVRNFFLTGQDVCTLGLTGAIASGYLTANVVAGYGGWENVILQREVCVDLGLKPAF